MKPSEPYAAILTWLQPRTLPWRAMIIAIDGVDHAGKSSLGRFLSWQLGMPSIETDLALLPARVPKHDTDLVKRLIDARIEAHRPVIVEGVFVLATLAATGHSADLLIRVTCSSERRVSSWPAAHKRYLAAHARAKSPDFDFDR